MSANGFRAMQRIGLDIVRRDPGTGLEATLSQDLLDSGLRRNDELTDFIIGFVVMGTDVRQ